MAETLFKIVSLESHESLIRRRESTCPNNVQPPVQACICILCTNANPIPVCILHGCILMEIEGNVGSTVGKEIRSQSGCNVHLIQTEMNHFVT